MDEKFSASEDRFQKLEERLDKIAANNKAHAVAGSPTFSSTSASHSWPTPRPPSSTVSSAPAAGTRTGDTATVPGRWNPRLLYIRGWSPFGSPSSSKISASEADLLDSKIKLATGALYDDMSYLTPHAANHQITHRILDADVHELRRALAQAFEKHGLSVHGKKIRIVLEHSPERRRDYSQYMDAESQLYSDPEMDSASPDRIFECQRGLKFYAAGTWQVLGEPAAHGWIWNRSSFIAAKLRIPSFLGGGSQHDNQGENGTNNSKDAERTGRAGENRHRVEEGGGEAEGAEGGVADQGDDPRHDSSPDKGMEDADSAQAR